MKCYIFTHSYSTMSVYPQFLQRVHDLGMYNPGYNYEEMYNIMVHNLTNNLPLTHNFIFTHNQMNEIYEYLDELLYDPPQTDAETETYTNQAANANEYQDQDTIYPENQDQNQYQTQNALQLFNTYLLEAMNNQYSININTINNTNTFNNTNGLNDEDTHDHIYDNDEFTYTHLVYYDNTNS